MEQVYALGITCIEFVQDWLGEYGGYFEVVNNMCNPHYITEYAVPALAAVDSVFATQLLLCMAFGSWLNTVMKWWLLEERPYWWVRSTSYYAEEARPRLLQTAQTCETGPGSPSGHAAAAGAVLALALMFAAHVAHDRKWQIPGWLRVVWRWAVAWCLGSVVLARLFVAAHFPHQCLLGALLGMLVSPALCVYVSDPYIWRYGGAKRGRLQHAAGALACAALGAASYGAVALRRDPMASVHQAFRWCERPESIRVTTTPVYALVHSTGYLLGLAGAVGPDVAGFRHDSADRSLVVSALGAWAVVAGAGALDAALCRDRALFFYLAQLGIAAAKPWLLLRAVPALASYPYRKR